ncbi:MULTISPECIES: MBL fold metallo-hydrolase [Pontibacillus]|uniref:MBL fold metallo-hydrolase n=1 Tax=Pontibacillus chungwhensis TaxID=265426 RepID=A0ABY8V0B9_9BACI|nr:MULTISPECIES: MBL fold metallo-hydrolase [Pontibacillus]MCD5324655.1 MBL fold metallo-hydrolase [Pontibacillus sp. HN14]WIF99050.1 MBL fold metallo-hydrolase [Pontibacillus chungwhensis]
MKLIQINSNCYYFSGPVNIGYIHQEESGMIVDAGIDSQTMKKVLKKLDGEGLPVTHLFITHAHSDHYGGGSYLQQDRTVYTFAPYYEEAILRNPSIEPLYLFGGNDPLPELRNKFLEGNSIFVDEVLQEGAYERDGFNFTTYLLPGHSYYQLGLKIQDCLYAGDAYFSEEQLHKHKIPFLTDAHLAIQSLYKLKGIQVKGALPGHGEYEEDFHDTVDANIAYYHELIHMLRAYIEEEELVSHEDVVAHMCTMYQIKVDQLSQWLLFRTAVTAYIIALLKQEQVGYKIHDYRWVFYIKEGEA